MVIKIVNNIIRPDGLMLTLLVFKVYLKILKMFLPVVLIVV